MAKDPALLFYWNDWQGGTATLTRHLKGCYMDLLYAQFNSGTLSLEQIKIVLRTDQAAWTVLSKKFIKVTENNVELFFNERMEAEKQKRRNFTEKQRLNGKKGGRKPKINPTLNPWVNPNESLLENENDNTEDDKEGVGEKEETRNRNFLLPQMLNAFCNANPNYLKDQNRDFPELLKIVQLLNRNKVPTIEDEILLLLDKWKSIVDFVVSHSFYNSYSIKQINTHLQAILLKKENNVTSNNTRNTG